MKSHLSNKILVIDASNLRAGGGVTHIVELLNHWEGGYFGEISIFSNTKTLNKITANPKISKQTHKYLNKGLIFIVIWKLLFFSKILNQKKKNASVVLFSPAGTYTGSFRPYVSMSQNMLIFNRKERKRFGKSFLRVKLAFLEKIQSKSFASASGIVFISQHAKSFISNKININHISQQIIHHGVNRSFTAKPKKQKEISECTDKSRFRLLYVSTISVYKHQIVLVKAILNLYKKGIPLHLDLVGGGYAPYVAKLEKELNSDPEYQNCVTYKGSIPYEEMAEIYQKADGFVFGSSCENMPNILIEAMSAGLPILSSNFPPMPEFLGDSHPFYFNPEKRIQTEESIAYFLKHHTKREQSSKITYDKAKGYYWEKCAKETFAFLSKF